MATWIRPQQMVLAIYKAGISLSRIAREAGVAVTTITRIHSGETKLVRESHEEAIRKLYDKYIGESK